MTTPIDYATATPTQIAGQLMIINEQAASAEWERRQLIADVSIARGWTAESLTGEGDGNKFLTDVVEATGNASEGFKGGLRSYAHPAVREQVPELREKGAELAAGEAFNGSRGSKVADLMVTHIKKGASLEDAAAVVTKKAVAGKAAVKARNADPALKAEHLRTNFLKAIKPLVTPECHDAMSRAIVLDIKPPKVEGPKVEEAKPESNASESPVDDLAKPESNASESPVDDLAALLSGLDSNAIEGIAKLAALINK